MKKQDRLQVLLAIIAFLAIGTLYLAFKYATNNGSETSVAICLSISFILTIVFLIVSNYHIRCNIENMKHIPKCNNSVDDYDQPLPDEYLQL
jgi:TRAP-type C4-dicarboxylate transport system permease small subunit